MAAIRSSSSSLVLNSFNLSAKSKSKSKFKYSDSSKALSTESELMKGMFLVRRTRNLTVDYSGMPNITVDYSVISTEGNSFRLLHDDDDDDDDLPRNLLSLLRTDKCAISPTYYVLECCGSLIWLLYQPRHSPHQYLVWDMETDSRRDRFPCVSPREDDDLDIWACGMAFDPSSGHYKLVVAWADYYYGQVYAEVFSMETRSSKAVDYPYGDPRGYNGCSSSIHINGIHYWIVREGFMDGSAPIMSFDFANDRFRDLIPLPKGEKKLDIDDDDGELSVVLLEFQGSLAAICCGSEDEPFIFEIWAWDARVKFWSLVSTFDIPAAANPCAVLNIYNDDKLFIKDTKGDLLLYDHATRRHENLGLRCDGQLVFYPYVKSSVGRGSRN